MGIGRILPEAETRQALRSLWKYNFARDAGAYVCGDFMSRRIWAVRPDPDGGLAPLQELCRVERGQISSFAEEPDGEHLVVCFNPGRIYNCFKFLPRIVAIHIISVFATRD